MTIRVSVVVALPQHQEVIELDLPAGSTVAEALEQSRVAERFAELASPALKVGIWSRPCSRDTPLRDGDRVEIYRPLAADAKQMRRARARRRT